jgi:hypothetical protein
MSYIPLGHVPLIRKPPDGFNRMMTEDTTKQGTRIWVQNSAKICMEHYNIVTS